MKHDLKKSVKDYIGSKRLSGEQLDDLMNLINSSEAKDSAVNTSSWLRIAGVAAVIIVAVGLLWNLSVYNRPQVSLLIAEEVVHNHLKMKPLEVNSDSLQDLQVYFNQLDFSLRTSSIVSPQNLQLLGGRYCSIQGITAAQLRMKHAQTGNLETLYQAPYNKNLFKELPDLHEGQQPVRHFINGIAVEIWIEKGILFARTYSNS